MEKNFEKYLSMLAHGNQPFVVYNDTNSYGDLTICVATEAINDRGEKKGILIKKFFSHIDEDTGLTIMSYLGETIEQDINVSLKNLVGDLTE